MEALLMSIGLVALVLWLQHHYDTIEDAGERMEERFQQCANSPIDYRSTIVILPRFPDGPDEIQDLDGVVASLGFDGKETNHAS